MIASICDENLSSRLYQDYSAKIHKENLEKIKKRNSSTIVNPKTSSCPKPKNFYKLALLREMSRENKILSEKLTGISTRKNPHKNNSTSPKTLNFSVRKKNTEKIIKENNSFIQRLIERPSQINIKQLKIEYELHEKYKENLSKKRVLDRIEKLVKKNPINVLSQALSKPNLTADSKSVNPEQGSEN